MQRFQTNDDQVIEVPMPLAPKLGNLIEVVMQETDTNQGIPLQNIDAKTFKQLVECVTISEMENKEQAKMLELEFIRRIPFLEQIALMEAANFLNNGDLMKRIAPVIAGQLKGKTTEQMREMLQVENDFTAEEMETIKAEQEWLMTQTRITE
jgi:S-phase kinase-associated protein 1